MTLYREIRSLHREGNHDASCGSEWHDECTEIDGFCVGCFFEWPCPTIRLLDGHKETSTSENPNEHDTTSAFIRMLSWERSRSD